MKGNKTERSHSIFRLRNRTVPSVLVKPIKTYHRIEPRFVGQANQRERLSQAFALPS